MEAILPIILQVISGAAGGGIVGNLVKTVGMSMISKMLLGGVGGLAGGALATGSGPLGGLLGGVLGMAGGGDAAGGMDMGSILGQVAGGAVGGGALTGIGGLIAGMMKK
ncbi:MAG: hypothetical protein WBC71_08190 [Salaquimonas sp.]